MPRRKRRLYGLAFLSSSAKGRIRERTEIVDKDDAAVLNVAIDLNVAVVLIEALSLNSQGAVEAGFEFSVGDIDMPPVSFSGYREGGDMEEPLRCSLISSRSWVAVSWFDCKIF